MNNYMVIIEGNESMFIQTNADKDIATKILTRYFLLKYFKVTCGGIARIFNYYGYTVKNFDEVGISLHTTFKLKNYAIIDLSDMKQCIRNTLSSN